jgi:hypothetical protein
MEVSLKRSPDPLGRLQDNRIEIEICKRLRSARPDACSQVEDFLQRFVVNEGLGP